MKLQLSTLLLLVALIAVCIGWFTDRQNLSRQLLKQKQTRAQRDEQIYLGAVMMGASSGKFHLFDRFDFDDVDEGLVHIKNDPKYQQVLAEECVTELLNIYEYQNEIEIVGAMITGSWDARLDAREALGLLNCEQTEQFFEIAKSLDDFGNPQFHPELHDASSDEYKSLHRFISDTIAIKDQMYVKGFENDPRRK
jgi:hypothetical protein